MKRKGFTLVELLAIIVIIGILVLVTTPLVLGTLEKTRKNSFEETVKGLVRAVNIDNDRQGYKSTKYKVVDGILFDDDDEKIETAGGSNENGILATNDSGKVAAAINNGKWCAIKNYNSNKIEIKDYNEGTCKIDISICNTVSFETDSWETIACAVKNNELDKYNLGDEKEVVLTGDYAGTYKVRIANTSTPTECNEVNFSQSACGFVVEFKDIITKSVMNKTSGKNVGGWPSSEMYNLVNTTIYNALPEELKKEILNTKVISSHGSTESNNFTSTDKLYLLSTKEVWESNSGNYDTSRDSTRQLDYYKNNVGSGSNYSVVIKQYQGLNAGWWLRSARSNSSSYFYSVDVNGSWTSNDASTASPIGVAPAFRVG